MTVPATSGNQLLPWRDQKSYDLGARSAREEIDELRREVQTLTEERDEALLRSDQAQDVIRNQNSHMGWLEQQLKASGYRERAYARVIRDGTERMLTEAREILEGGGLSTAEAQVIQILGRQIEGYRGELILVRGGIELVAQAMDDSSEVPLRPEEWHDLVAGWAAELSELLAKEPAPPLSKSPVPAPVTESDVCGC